MMGTGPNKVVWLMLYRKREQMVAVFPSGLQIFLSVSLKVPRFSSHAAKQHCITLISELFCIRNGVCVMMPGFGTFHHLKEQQLTLQLFTTRCAWPHLPFPLISMGNPPDTNHYHGPCPAKPTERVSTGFSGSRWKFCVPTFPLLVQYVEPQSCGFCLNPTKGSTRAWLSAVLSPSHFAGELHCDGLAIKSFLPLALVT